MTTPFYERSLDPPEKEPSVIPCPNCGSQYYEQIYLAMTGKYDSDYVGCSDCLKTIYYDDVELEEDAGYEG